MTTCAELEGTRLTVCRSSICAVVELCACKDGTLRWLCVFTAAKLRHIASIRYGAACIFFGVLWVYYWIR